MGRTVHAVRICDQSWAGANFEANDVLPTSVCVELDNGDGATYIDGAHLRAEKERLKAENERLRAALVTDHVCRVCNDRLERDRDVCGVCYDTMESQCDEARTELADLQRTFDLAYAADMRGVELWRKEHPGSELVQPDRAVRMAWLLDRLQRYEVVVEAARALWSKVAFGEPYKPDMGKKAATPYEETMALGRALAALAALGKGEA